jgi:hypothetical protein
MVNYIDSAFANSAGHPRLLIPCCLAITFSPGVWQKFGEYRKTSYLCTIIAEKYVKKEKRHAL